MTYKVSSGTLRHYSLIHSPPLHGCPKILLPPRPLSSQLCRASVVAVRQTGSRNLPAPVDLHTSPLSAHSVRLHWTDPSLDHTQRIVDERYYNVYYHAVPHGKNLSVIVKALHVTLHDLEPGRRYRFKVRTVKGDHTSPFSGVATERTSTTDHGQY